MWGGDECLDRSGGEREMERERVERCVQTVFAHTVGGVSTDYCRQSHVAFSTAGMCFVIDKSTAQYSEA